MVVRCMLSVKVIEEGFVSSETVAAKRAEVKQQSAGSVMSFAVTFIAEVLSARAHY